MHLSRTHDYQMATNYTLVEVYIAFILNSVIFIVRILLIEHGNISEKRQKAVLNLEQSPVGNLKWNSKVPRKE